MRAVMVEQRQPGPVMRDEDRGHGWVWTTWVPVGHDHWRRLGGESFWRVPTDIQKHRYALCRDCDAFEPRTTACRYCACVMGIQCWHAEAACPKQKWPAVEPPAEATGSPCEP